MTDLKWTHKTPLKISRLLRRAGITIGARTIGRLLKKLRYSLHVNCKQISTRSSPQRNQQYQYIQKTWRTFERESFPIISVDAKKKEMLRNFKNNGRVWGYSPIYVNDHDFRRDAVGMAIPYGVYDVRSNQGHVFIGTSHDTSDFATQALAEWWKQEGRSLYPNAKRLLILADAGGSNAPRTRAWKRGIHTKLASPFGLKVTVCHYPPGASKWNPIEHRLFSEVSKNWAGQPLDSYETMLNYIRATTTKTGLLVKASLINGEYPTGVKISDSQMKQVKLRNHKILPIWNYTISPN